MTRYVFEFIDECFIEADSEEEAHEIFLAEHDSFIQINYFDEV